jgi:WASH complex subunit strumpellin
LLNEIVAFTNPKKTVFIQSAFGFYDLEQKKEVLTLKTLNILYKCIGISGLQGIDYLLSLKIMESLKRLLHEFNKINDD